MTKAPEGGNANLDIFHVIYKIDGQEFEDKIPSDLTIRI